MILRVDQVLLREAIIQENPLKSGFLQIDVTPPLPPKISGMVIFQQIQISKYPPTPDFSGTNGFLHFIFSIKKGVCQDLEDF